MRSPSCGIWHGDRQPDLPWPKSDFPLSGLRIDSTKTTKKD
jgi:hypothetical protein